MKVKILEGRGWYQGQEGKTFEVKDERCESAAFKGYYELKDMGGYMIDPANCEVVYDEPRFYRHEGKDYVVPEWAKYVTCDGKHSDKTPKPLFAWEDKPTMKSQGYFYGYFYADSGKRTMMEEYVKPLPDGAFIVEI